VSKQGLLRTTVSDSTKVDRGGSKEDGKIGRREERDEMGREGAK